MIVAIAGPIGVGKSTVASGLATRLKYLYISGGEVLRDLARARGVSIVEANRLAEQDPRLDRELDERQRRLASVGNCVVESRLSGWMVDADIKIWLRAPLDIRAARVAEREGQQFDTARADLLRRESSEWNRYKILYNIDIHDLSPYHLVIDTVKWPADAIIEALAWFVRSAVLESVSE